MTNDSGSAGAKSQKQGSISLMVTFALGDNALKPRGAPRRKAFQCITIGTAEGDTRAHILDLSRSGARMHASARLEVGASVMLSSEVFLIKGRIVWTKKHIFGVHFEQSISDSDVGRLAG
ncbi:PilZ domain-containing protein [Sphingomonas sp. JC676]|uniref:PilZ domain-containing protein n=1 Tax=Sphingomonas sp. JC676 TaxID=2768065 RepID=UPI0016583667|nr:PilZ domain-containing protein [Sphingomonas sp. JC676]MBC9030813.1 PilZ domain-containing protein [Sphingomonas sp. JC676]